MMTAKTKHGKIQGQRRCIPDAMIGILRECGKTTYSQGCRILHLHDKRAWHNAREFMASIGMLPDNHLRDACAVINEREEVVTLEWRYKRIFRDGNTPRRRRGKNRW